MTEEFDVWLRARLDRLHRLSDMSDSELIDRVLDYGLSPALFEDSSWIDQFDATAEPDRALAAALCDGCPVLDECLELDLRVLGELTTGVFGGLNETDRRSLYRQWQTERNYARPEEGEEDL